MSTQFFLDRLRDSMKCFAPPPNGVDPNSTFDVDFPRIREVEVIGGTRYWNNAPKDNATKDNTTKDNTTKDRDGFIAMIREVNPALETAIKTMMHQGGALFSGRNAMENGIFSHLGINGQGSHAFSIKVIDANTVTIVERVKYDHLQLYYPEYVIPVSFSEGKMEGQALTEKQKQAITVRRESIMARYPLENLTPSQKEEEKKRTYLLSSDSEVFGVRKKVGKDIGEAYKGLIFAEYLLDKDKPLSLNVTYTLQFDSKKEQFELLALTENDIDIEFPGKFIQQLVTQEADNSLGKYKNMGIKTKASKRLTKLMNELVNEFVATLKKAILLIASGFSDGSKPYTPPPTSTFIHHPRF
jgi:hypothetical protein